MAGQILCRVIEIYNLILFARVILSFVQVFRPGWAPGPMVRPFIDFIYGLTDPPVNYLRRVIPQPMGFPFDLAFTVWFLIVIFLLRPLFCSL
jgi:YggT family protein